MKLTKNQINLINKFKNILRDANIDFEAKEVRISDRHATVSMDLVMTQSDYEDESELFLRLVTQRQESCDFRTRRKQKDIVKIKK